MRITESRVDELKRWATINADGMSSAEFDHKDYQDIADLLEELERLRRWEAAEE